MAKVEAKPLEKYKEHISNGIWFKIHTDAEAAVTMPLMEAYAYNFRNLCDKMGCSCENHCSQMLNGDFPPEKYFHIVDEEGVPVGCLYHSIDCHNAVNQRLGKPTYQRSQIVPLYRPKEFTPCTDKGAESKGAKTQVPKGNRKGGLSLEQLARKYPDLIGKLGNSENRRGKSFHLV